MFRNQPITFTELSLRREATFEVTYDEKLHKYFSNLVGDFSPIHCDEAFCSKTRFEKRIGYAFFLTGLLSRLYGEHLLGGSSICIKQDAQFRRPFFINDRITVKGKVVKKISSTRFVEIQSNMYRKDKEEIFQGIGIVQILFGE